MTNEQKSSLRKGRLLWFFIAGATLGLIVGLLTYEMWDLVGPYQAQISAGFWGLVGGILGVVANTIYRFVRS
jgi:hypothetical protein